MSTIDVIVIGNYYYVQILPLPSEMVSDKETRNQTLIGFQVAEKPNSKEKMVDRISQVSSTNEITIMHVSKTYIVITENSV